MKRLTICGVQSEWFELSDLEVNEFCCYVGCAS